MSFVESLEETTKELPADAVVWVKVRNIRGAVSECKTWKQKAVEETTKNLLRKASL